MFPTPRYMHVLPCKSMLCDTRSISSLCCLYVKHAAQAMDASWVLLYLLCLCHSQKTARRSADPLEMDDGKELIEMVCTSYESPDDAPEDCQHDFSMLTEPSLQLKHAKCFLLPSQPHMQPHMTVAETIEAILSSYLFACLLLQSLLGWPNPTHSAHWMLHLPSLMALLF